MANEQFFSQTALVTAQLASLQPPPTNPKTSARFFHWSYYRKLSRYLPFAHNTPDNRVRRHDKFRVPARRILEQFTLCLNEDVMSRRQLHSIHAAQIGPNVTH